MSYEWEGILVGWLLARGTIGIWNISVKAFVYVFGCRFVGDAVDCGISQPLELMKSWYHLGERTIREHVITS